MITQDELDKARAATIKRLRAAAYSAAYGDVPDDEIIANVQEAISEFRAEKRAAIDRANARPERAQVDPDSAIGRLLAMISP